MDPDAALKAHRATCAIRQRCVEAEKQLELLRHCMSPTDDVKPTAEQYSALVRDAHGVCPTCQRLVIAATRHSEAELWRTSDCY